MFNPTRKPARKTVAPASTHTGHTADPTGGRSPRATHTHRASTHRSGGYTSGMAAKTFPWLKNQREADSDTSASRSALLTDNRRRQSTRPITKTAQKASQIQGLLIFVPPNEPL